MYGIKKKVNSKLKIEKNEVHKKSKKAYIIGAIIMLVQIIFFLYWGNAKSNYYVDELFSMESVRNLTCSENDGRYITDSSEWEFNKWVSNSEYKKRFILSTDDLIFNYSIPEVIHKFIFERNYNVLLNVFESAFNLGCISARPAIIMNIIILLIAECFLVRLFRKLKMRDFTIYSAMAMFGFSAYIIGMVVYVRFYILVIMYLMIILNLFYIVWSSSKINSIICSEIGIIILTYLQLKNSELTVPFFGGVSLCLLVGLFFRKSWKTVVSYTIIIICGLIYAITKTPYVAALLDTNNSNNYDMTASVANNLRNVSMSYIINGINHFVDLFKEDYLCGKIFVILFILLWVSIIIYENYNKCFCLHDIVTNVKKYRISDEMGFVLVILGTAIFCILFSAISNLTLDRYLCFEFCLLTIVIWYLIDRIIKKTINDSTIINIGIAIIVCIIAIIPFKTRNIDNIYEDEKDFIDEVEKYGPIDVVLVSEINDDNTISLHELYDCVCRMPDESGIYAINKDNYLYDNIEYPESFLLWSHEYRDISSVIENLKEQGYTIEDLGQNHVSQAYFCER